MIRKPENIILGTANFGQEYNGIHLDNEEQAAIWQMCRDVGVKWVDTATSYGNISIPEGFTICDKILTNEKSRKKLFPNQRYICFSHNYSDDELYHASLYCPEQVNRPFVMIQFPYSIFNRTWEPYLFSLKSRGTILFARSIFARGDALKMFTVKQCLDFVVANPFIDKIVVGVENAGQLKQIVECVCNE